MMLSLDEIQNLEMNWDTLEIAASELEKRIEYGSDDCETITRLGFLCWYFVVEQGCLLLKNPVENYQNRFKELLETYSHRYESNPDFCLSFGSGTFGWWYFFGLTEELGRRLLDHAGKLDNRYYHIGLSLKTDEKLQNHFKSMGAYGSYFGDRMQSLQHN